jgi:hypothetical protein
MGNGNRVLGVDWIHPAQSRGRWRALVNTVMNCRASYKAGDFLTSLINSPDFKPIQHSRLYQHFVNNVAELRTEILYPPPLPRGDGNMPRAPSGSSLANLHTVRKSHARNISIGLDHSGNVY